LQATAHGREPRGIFQHIDQGLFDQRRMHIQQGQLRGYLHLDLQRCQRRAQSTHGAGDDIPGRHPVPRQLEGAVAQACHVEQVLDVTVQALGFVTGDLEQGLAIVRRQGRAQGQQAVDAATHGGQRRAQVMGHRGQQGTAQLFGFTVQARRFQVMGQVRAGQGLRHRLHQRAEQTSAGIIEPTGLLFGYREQRQHLALPRYRQPPPTPRRQCGGAQPGRLRVVAGPLRGRQFGGRERHRPALGHLPALLAALEQTDVQPRPTLQVLRGCTEHRLAVGRRSQQSGQLQQLRGVRLGFAQGAELLALTRGQVAGERCHQQKEQQGQHVFLTLDAQGEIGWDEQKVVRQKRQRGATERRPRAAADRHQQHGGEEHQGDIGQVQHLCHGPGQPAGQKRGQHRQGILAPTSDGPRARRWR
jgi:hypothetical protein